VARVVTLNLWGIRGEWPARRRVLADGLRELQPDLVAFVEAIETDDYDQVVDLLGPDYHVAHQTAREPDGQGASIATRWPISAVHEVDLHVTPRTADFACVALVAEIAAPEPYGPLVFVDHVPSWQLQLEHERELQALAAARFVEELAGERHVVFAGDFTADPGSAGVRFLTGRQSLDGTSVCYRDAWESAAGVRPVSDISPVLGNGCGCAMKEKPDPCGSGLQFVGAGADNHLPEGNS